jgi:hypothetical protein
MQLNGLEEDQIELLISSLKVNPNLKEGDKEELLRWMRIQLKEQQTGGAWKARIREAGIVI